jgi:hypothetical protein
MVTNRSFENVAIRVTGRFAPFSGLFCKPFLQPEFVLRSMGDLREADRGTQTPRMVNGTPLPQPADPEEPAEATVGGVRPSRRGFLGLAGAATVALVAGIETADQLVAPRAVRMEFPPLRPVPLSRIGEWTKPYRDDRGTVTRPRLIEKGGRVIAHSEVASEHPGGSVYLELPSADKDRVDVLEYDPAFSFSKQLDGRPDEAAAYFDVYDEVTEVFAGQFRLSPGDRGSFVLRMASADPESGRGTLDTLVEPNAASLGFKGNLRFVVVNGGSDLGESVIAAYARDSGQKDQLLGAWRGPIGATRLDFSGRGGDGRKLDLAFLGTTGADVEGVLDALHSTNKTTLGVPTIDLDDTSIGRTQQDQLDLIGRALDKALPAPLEIG